jgi:hypothetical protein
MDTISLSNHQKKEQRDIANKPIVEIIYNVKKYLIQKVRKRIEKEQKQKRQYKTISVKTETQPC